MTCTINVDDKIKENIDRFCDDVGLSFEALIGVYLTKVSREGRIPFEIDDDPFYSEENMARLRRAVADIRAGKNMTEHELIEVDEDA